MLSRLPVTLATLFSLAVVVAAIPANVNRLRAVEPTATFRKCGSDLSPEAVNEKEQAFASRLAANGSPVRLANGTGNFTVPVNFNVIYASMNASDGYVPDSQIEAQIDVLNQDYSGTGLSFKLENITRTLNATWFNNVAPDTSLQTDMKNTLRKGDVSTLNLYTVGFTSGDAQGLLGYSTFPSDYAANPMDDGVVVLYESLPGGPTGNFSLGRTSTHEIGHWLGLYHPFQGGCDGSGDFVDDTPAEAIPGYGCPISRDTCVSPGLDPVQNFMDYSNDSCMNNFTPGQIARVKSQISTYRGIDM
jgi:hypothetical protein